MANYNFNKDIIEGKKGEHTVTNILLDNIPNTKLIQQDNDTSEYDVIIESTITNIQYKVEIKTDVYCTLSRDTGNMFIEYECRGKPSGIEVTLSDLFVMYYPYLKQVWTIPTPKLKELLKKPLNSLIRDCSMAGDDGSNTKGYLIPRYEYKRYFKIIKTNM